MLTDDSVSSLIVPAYEGYMGILPNHAPLVAELTVGEITVRGSDGSVRLLATSGGFMMVEENHVAILADSAEPSETIDVRRAEEAKRRAEQRLAEKRAGTDIARAEAALQRAVNRLKVAGRV